jgi:hypothetical protein
LSANQCYIKAVIGQGRAYSLHTLIVCEVICYSKEYAFQD